MKIFKSIITKLLYQCFGAFIKSPMSTFKLILVKKLYPYYLLGYNEENIPEPQCFDSYSNSNVQKNDKFFDVCLAQSCHEHCHIQQKQEAFPTKAFKKLFIAWKNEIGQNHCQGQKTSLVQKWTCEDLSSEYSNKFKQFHNQKEMGYDPFHERNLFKTMEVVAQIDI